jgi:hypothetical protein
MHVEAPAKPAGFAYRCSRYARFGPTTVLIGIHIGIDVPAGAIGE